MGYVLGIDMGTGWTTAAVSRLDGTGWGPPAVIGLGASSASAPSVLHVASDGSILDDSARRSVPPSERQAVRGFVRRIGDDVPLVVGGRPCTPQMLAAALVRRVVARAVAQEGTPPRHTVVSHPGTWGGHRRRLLADALRRHGVDDATLLPEPITAAEGAATHAWPDTGDALAVFALGGAHVGGAVVRRARSGAFELLGCAENTETGADDFDDAVFAHVRAEVGGQGRWDELRWDDPGSWEVLADLRAACADAKERLSTAAEAEIEVRLPWLRTVVTVTRSDFEDMIRSAVTAAVDLVVRVTRTSGLASRQLAGVVSVGGATRIPLLADTLAEALPCPAAAQPEPEYTAALGAALAAARLARSTPRVPAPRVPAPRIPGDERHPVSGDGVAVPAGSGQPPRPPVEITALELPARARRALPVQRRQSDGPRRRTRSDR